MSREQALERLREVAASGDGVVLELEYAEHVIRVRRTEGSQFEMTIAPENEMASFTGFDRREFASELFSTFEEEPLGDRQTTVFRGLF